MYGAAIKKHIMLAVAILPMLIATACGSQKSEEEINAERLLSEVKSCYSGKQYDKAMSMIDSLMKTYPGLLDVQRAAMHYQTLIIEKQTLRDSTDNEQLYSENRAIADSLLKQFRYIKTADMVEGYYVPKQIGADELIKATGIETRIDESKNIYLVTSLYGSSIRHSSLTASSEAGEASTKEVPASNPRNYRFSDNGTSVEMVTFNAQECDSLCAFIADNASKTIKVRFAGKSRSHTITLPERTKKAIAACYRLYQAESKVKTAELNRLKYTKKLQLTRKQIKQTATNIQGERK